jgi:glycosyltransferase involved in cell wall biosynthesis
MEKSRGRALGDSASGGEIMSLRILQLSTYPARIPRHGGQARVANIRAVLERSGHEVCTFAVYEPEHYGAAAVEPHDIAFPQSSVFRESALPFCTDYASGDFLAGDERAFRKFAALVARLDPHIITLEQPWLWPAVQRIRREAPDSLFKIIYSSQNIEAPLKREILGNLTTPEVESIVQKVEARQREVTAAADLTIACTESDAVVLRAFGARRVIIAHNGIVERRADSQAVRDWRWHLGDRQFALFVGSAYPPNAAGFWEMFTPSLAFLAPNECILAVGGVSALLVEYATYKTWQAINDSRLVRAGFQSEEALAALIELASCVVLPITRGGGSNIKTAEAVHSGKPVIGTSKSFCGHERTLALPHIYSVDQPAEFRRLVKGALAGTLPPAGPDDPDVRNSVLWRETLADIPDEFEALAEAPDGLKADPEIGEYAVPLRET